MSTAVKVRKNPYRALLLKKREELLASVKAEPDVLDASIRTPDEVELAAKAVEQDVAAVTVSLRSRMLREVEKSVKRIADGTCGVGEGCGEESAPNRVQP